MDQCATDYDHEYGAVMPGLIIMISVNERNIGFVTCKKKTAQRFVIIISSETSNCISYIVYLTKLLPSVCIYCIRYNTFFW